MIYIYEASKLNRPIYDYSRPVDWSVDGSDPVILRVIRSQAFQRLNEVRFLGSIDYVFVRGPNGAKGNIRYTRLQHSLGVAKLALSYSEKRHLSPEDRRMILLAALLHDVGHAPFSHSLEPVFQEAFGIDHHQATQNVIEGTTRIGHELNGILREFAVDIDRLLEIIAGKSSEYDAFFSGPINFDTIEGILRSLAYLRPNLNIPSPEAVANSARRRKDEKDQTEVDNFWLYKDQVYKLIIHSHEGLFADGICQAFMRKNLDRITKDDYFSTESLLFRKLPGLRKALASQPFVKLAARHLDRTIEYKARRFYVIKSADFFARDDQNRYVQTKINRAISSKALVDFDAATNDRDLFNDGSNSKGPKVFTGQAHQNTK